MTCQLYQSNLYIGFKLSLDEEILKLTPPTKEKNQFSKLKQSNNLDIV